jgi:acyl-CoA thioesterase
MDAGGFLGLQPTHNPHRWFLPVTAGISTGGRFLFGGCGLAAAIVAMERVAERKTVWATAQYLSYAQIGDVMDVDVTVASAGHFTSQARVVGHVGDREILTVNAALGERPAEEDAQWARLPEVPSPEDCPTREMRPGAVGSLMDRLDIRLARGSQWDALEPAPGGRSALWVRMPDIETSAAALAVLGDYVPFGLSQALGSWHRSNSLDNTLRIHRVVPTDWVLLDIAAHGVHNGFGHGRVHLWNRDGTLLATASQSAIVRGPVPQGEVPR